MELGQAPLLAAPLPSLRAFRETFRCELIDRLDTIAAGDSSTSRDRFITVFPRHRPNSYVQCIFVEHDARMLCEAASGAFRPGRRTGQPPAPPGDPVRLAELGFVPLP